MLFQKLVGLDVNKQLDLVGNIHVRKKITKRRKKRFFSYVIGNHKRDYCKEFQNLWEIFPMLIKNEVLLDKFNQREFKVILCQCILFTQIMNCITLTCS